MSTIVLEQSTNDPLSYSRSNRLSVTREFNVMATSKLHAKSLLESERNIRIGTIYEDIAGNKPDSFVRASSIEIRPKNKESSGTDERLHIIKVRYEPVNLSNNNEDELEVDGPPTWSAEYGQDRIPVEIDINGVKITNSAGVPFDPPLTAIESTEIQIAEFIRSGLTWVEASRFVRQYNSRLNMLEWQGAPPRSVFCHAIKPEALDNDVFTKGGLVKFVGRFEFKNQKTLPRVLSGSPNGENAEFDPDLGFNLFGSPTDEGPIIQKDVSGFDSTPLDRGKLRKVKVDANNTVPYKPITVKDEQGEEVQVSEPVFLDGRGEELVGGSPVALEFKTIDEVDFNSLGF